MQIKINPAGPILVPGRASNPTPWFEAVPQRHDAPNSPNSWWSTDAINSKFFGTRMTGLDCTSLIVAR